MLEQLHYYGFYGAIIAFALLELVRPWRRQELGLTTRWSANVGLFLCNSIGLRLILPIGMVEWASAQALEQPLLLSLHSLPLWAGIAVSLLVLDLWSYTAHRLMHNWALIWRAHQVHHIDLDVDFTTSARNHPLELLFSYPGYIVLIAAFQLPVEGVILFAILSQLAGIWTHANVRWPIPFERTVRLLLVTPNMHAVHHSAERSETDSNYGTIFSFFDRIFGSYTEPTAEREAKRVIGLEYCREERDMRLDRALLLPFLSQPGRRERSSVTPVQPAE